MGDAAAVNPLVHQFRRGGIPLDLRLMAAEAALPLKPADLLELLHHLLSDAEAQVRERAARSLGTLAAEELHPLLKDRATAPDVLAWALRARKERELQEAVLQNPSTPDEAIESVVGALAAELAELVVINQVRLLRRTSLLEALEVNPRLNRDQQRRLRELRETFRIGLEPAPPAAEAPAAPVPVAVAAAEVEEPEEPLQEGPATEDEAMVRYLSEEERQQAEKVSVVQRLYRLNTAEKVITALKGTREERAVLVHDPNRIVAAAVLGSPRLTDAEIEAFAAMKNVSGEVLRQIGKQREWTRRYAVVANLVRNPRTPLGVSLGMVSRLTPRDLKNLSVDRNVPDVIRKQAQKFVHDPVRK